MRPPQVLKYVYASRNGLSETELFDLIPTMTHNFWVPLETVLLDHFILVYRSGLLVFAHEQVSGPRLSKLSCAFLYIW